MIWSVKYDAADIGVDTSVQLLSEAQREMCQPLIVISVELRVIKVEISIVRKVIV